MSTPLTKLTDADLERIHHMIRRDAHSDLEIAREVEAALAAGAGRAVSLGPTDQAKIMVISRYRHSKPYQKWLTAWENKDTELKKQVALQKQRFDLIADLVKNVEDEGFAAVSRSIQARLLTLAAECSDADLREAVAGRGWIKNLLTLVQSQAALEKKAVGEKAVEIVQDKKLSAAERESRIKEIFGIAS